MRKFAQINADGTVLCCVESAREVTGENVIEVPLHFDTRNKRWNGKEWEEYIPEPISELPTELERMAADIAYLKMIRLSK